jgi:lysophospholipase L1-like esterase
MGKAGAARKLAAAAAYGGGGLSLAGASLFGVIVAEARLARRMIGDSHDFVPDSTGWYGRDRPGPAIRIALLGDSIASAYGVKTVEETTGAQIGAGISQVSGRRVFVRRLSRVGGQSSELAGQIERALPMHADVAVILVGANDVTHGVRPSASVRALGDAVRVLTEAGIQVVVGTCPDLGTLRPVAPPLRQLARRWSRRLAAAQTIATVEQGGRSVSLSDILGPDFDADPVSYFGPDRFHPSAQGYASLAAVMVPSVLSALGLGPDDEEHPIASRGEAVLPVARAAVRAARTPGTELDGTEVAGREHSSAGRWVTLMRRQRHDAQPEAPTSAPEPETAPAKD